MQYIDDDELLKLHMFIDKLNSEDDAIILVEGKRDIEALTKLGYKGNIRTLNSFKGLHKLAEHLENTSKVILLLDMDKKGKYLTNRMRSMMNNIDLFYKKELMKITKGKIRRIEELVIYTKYHVASI